jgi:fermentation-respiration switch protein FrsA (DUF1100 family)
MSRVGRLPKKNLIGVCQSPLSQLPSSVENARPRATSFRPIHRAGALAIIVLALCAIGCLLSIAYESFRWTNPPWYQYGTLTAWMGSSKADAHRMIDPWQIFGLPFEDVDFQTAGHAVLRGWLVSGSSGNGVGIVTAHGQGTDRREFLKDLPLLERLGAATLLFDYREHGLSDGTGGGNSMSFREAQDVSAAVDYMKRERGMRRVVVLGVSLGAVSAILAAAHHPNIDGVIAESSFTSMEAIISEDLEESLQHHGLLRNAPLPSWLPHLVVTFTAWRNGIDHIEAPEDVIGQISPRPILLIHGTGDTSVDWSQSAKLYSVAGEPKELWIAVGPEHTEVYDRYPEEYEHRLARFLDEIR